MQNVVEKTIWSMLAQKSLKVLGALKLFSLGGKNFLRQVFGVCIILILYTGFRHIDEYIKYCCKYLTKLFRS
jgi:hypothetical protein